MIIFSLQKLATRETCYEGGVPKTRRVSPPGIEQTLAGEGGRGLGGGREGNLATAWHSKQAPAACGGTNNIPEYPL